MEINSSGFMSFDFDFVACYNSHDVHTYKNTHIHTSMCLNMPHNKQIISCNQMLYT